MEDNETTRKNLYELEETVKYIQKKKIGYYLNKLENENNNNDNDNDNDNDIKIKIKHIKNLYQIYNMLLQTKKVMIHNEDFDITDTTINEFYKYLGYNINFLKEEIYSFIKLLGDEDFYNKKNEMKYLGFMSFERRCELGFFD